MCLTEQNKTTNIRFDAKLMSAATRTGTLLRELCGGDPSPVAATVVAQSV